MKELYKFCMENSDRITKSQLRKINHFRQLYCDSTENKKVKGRLFFEGYDDNIIVLLQVEKGALSGYEINNFGRVVGINLLPYYKKIELYELI